MLEGDEWGRTDSGTSIRLSKSVCSTPLSSRVASNELTKISIRSEYVNPALHTKLVFHTLPQPPRYPLPSPNDAASASLQFLRVGAALRRHSSGVGYLCPTLAICEKDFRRFSRRYSGRLLRRPPLSARAKLSLSGVHTQTHDPPCLGSSTEKAAARCRTQKGLGMTLRPCPRQFLFALRAAKAEPKESRLPVAGRSSFERAGRVGRTSLYLSLTAPSGI